MLDLGTQELIVIFIVAFLVFGPKKMPELARTLGKGLKQLKSAMRGITESLEEAGSDMKEAGSDIIEEINGAKSDFQDSIYKSIESNVNEIGKATEEKKAESNKEKEDDTPRLFGDSQDEEKPHQENNHAVTEEKEKKEPGANG